MRALVILALLVSCVPGADERITRLQRSATSLVAALDEVAEQFERNTAALAAAETTFREAQADAQRAGKTAAEAEAAFNEAAEGYRFAAYTIIVASASMRPLCAGKMTTRQFREMVAAEAKRLGDPTTDHICPRAWGGADHAGNYQLLERNQNSSYGKALLPKLVDMPFALLRGCAVSAATALLC